LCVMLHTLLLSPQLQAYQCRYTHAALCFPNGTRRRIVCLFHTGVCVCRWCKAGGALYPVPCRLLLRQQWH
jgi:hypothetical protein